MPLNFPGIHGSPATGLPSFVTTEGLPLDWGHLVTQSRALALAVEAAAYMPAAQSPEAVAGFLEQIAHAKTVLKNTLTTVERIEAWSRQNLGMDTPKPMPARPSPSKPPGS